MEIVPWEHPSLFWLTLDGVKIAGPARRELLESFACDLARIQTCRKTWRRCMKK